MFGILSVRIIYSIVVSGSKTCIRIRRVEWATMSFFVASNLVFLKLHSTIYILHQILLKVSQLMAKSNGNSSASQVEEVISTYHVGEEEAFIRAAVTTSSVKKQQQ